MQTPWAAQVPPTTSKQPPPAASWSRQPGRDAEGTQHEVMVLSATEIKTRLDASPFGSQERRAVSQGAYFMYF